MPTQREVNVHAKNDRSTFLSTLPATQSDRTAALAIVGISAILFALAVPFAGTPLVQVPAFVASYQSALAVSDIITAVLLLSQFAVLRSRALLLLSTGYLFTAAAAVTHALTFPGLFAPTGLLGASYTDHGLALHDLARRVPAVRAGLWLAQGRQRRQQDRRTDRASHRARRPRRDRRRWSSSRWIVTAQHDLLPVLLRDGRYTTTMIGVVSFVWSLSFAALITLWFRKPHTVIDVWLMVTMCAWLFDIALSAIVNVARYDLGFYAGRLYGLGAASFVLAVLLIENVRLQAHTVGLVGRLREQSASDRDFYGKRLALYGAVVESSNDAIITEIPRRRHHGLEQGRRTPVRLFGRRGRRPADRPHRAAGPQGRNQGHPQSHQQQRVDRPARDSPHPQGRPAIDVVLNVSPLRSDSGQIIGASKIAHDITEEKQSREKLRRETEERQRIFETSRDLILVTDGFGNFIQVSPSVKDILGLSPEDMIGHSATDFIHPDDLENTRSEMRAARRGQTKRSFEARYYHFDGHEVTLNWMGTWSEPVKRHFFIGRDLTEKQAAEAQFRQVAEDGLRSAS